MIARWNVIDPLAEKHYETNPYNYVLNNPMLYIDPLGLDTSKVGSTAVIKPKDVVIGDDGKEIVSALPEVAINSAINNLNSSNNNGPKMDLSHDIGRSTEWSFEGVNVDDSRSLGYGAAYTFPWRITVSPNIYSQKDLVGSFGRQVLMHEFGHVLQYKRYGTMHTIYQSLSSVISAATSTNFEHQRNWSETEANTLSYFYFGQPKEWDMTGFPINIHNVSPEDIKSLINRK